MLIFYSREVISQCSISFGQADILVCGEKIQLSIEPEWLFVSTGLSATLRDVIFVTPNLGFVCGDSGALLKTTNGGASFNPSSLPTNQHLRTLFFTSNDTGFVAGDSAVLFYTTNGGNSWNLLNTGLSPTYGFTALYFINRNIGYLTTSNNLILITRNGGQT